MRTVPARETRTVPKAAVSGWVSEGEPSSWKRFHLPKKGWDERMTEDPEGARTPRGERPNPERPLRHRLVLRGAGRRHERRARETTSRTTGRRNTPKVLASPLLSAPVTPVTGLGSARCVPALPLRRHGRER
jgi:hypothetical protein